jgi:hypothetical protein
MNNETKYKITPTIKVFFEEKSFNHLIATLDKFISLEHKVPGNEIISNAKTLKAKILKYARTYISKDGKEKCVVYFFEKEASALIELLNYSTFNYKKAEKDYYTPIKVAKSKAKKKQ